MIDAATYFSLRAPRYDSALRAFPTARALDFIPHVAALAAVVKKATRLRVCDAFGGTGFLASGLSRETFDFVVCDCCEEMLRGAQNLGATTHVTQDDFVSVLKQYGAGSFDVVFSHGGLHHVVESLSHTIQEGESRRRQCDIAIRLGQLLKPGGLLVIADIPNERPDQISDNLFSSPINSATLKNFLRNEIARALGFYLGNSSAGECLETLQRRIDTELVAPTDTPVPRQFFDDYIAKKAPLGHVACYPDFDAVHSALIADGMYALGRVNFRGPWLFESRNEAGWFFREKFSLYEAVPLGFDPETEELVAQALQKHLGIRTTSKTVAVNWGVTYAAYRRR